MTRELVLHRWTCPICSETKASLSTMDTMNVEKQAKWALLSHIRTRNRGGHGRAGDYPSDFSPDDALDHVEIESEDRRRKKTAAR